MIQISGEVDSVTLGDTHAHINEELQSQRDRLAHDLKGQDAIWSARRQELERQIALSTRTVESVTSQLQIQKQRVEALASLHKKWLSFKDSGVVSKLQLLQSRDNLLQQRSVAQELERSRISAQQKRSELRGQLLRAPIEASSKKNELARQIAGVSEQISKNEAQRGIVLNAPRGGVVTTLLVHPGQQVLDTQQLLTLVPERTELMAELWIPTRAIGFVEVGSDVKLRYEAFPYQKFGIHRGMVAEVSRIGLIQENASVGQNQPKPRETFYRVLVQLESQKINVYGRFEALRPGMQLQADIAVERRRLLEWVFEPLYGIVRQQSPLPSKVQASHGG